MIEQRTISNNKNRTLQFLLIILLGVGIAACSFIPSHFLYQYYLIKSFQLLGFYGLGIVVLNIERKRLTEEDTFQLSSIIRFSLFILLSLFLLYFLTDVRQLLMSLSCWASFILPSVFFYGSRVFSQIAATEHKVWYPEDTSISKKAIVFVNSISIKFKYVPGNNNKYRVFETVVPTQMTLGKTFQAFLIQQNDYDYKDEDEDAEYVNAWQFFESGMLGLKFRPLDPYLNIWENNIRPNSIIKAKRVMVKRASNIKKLQTISNANT